MSADKSMRGVPPFSRNEFVPYTVVLRRISSVVNTIVPTTSRCPACSVDAAFHLIRDPTSSKQFAGGFWWFCEECGYAGDTIEVYRDVRGFSTLVQADEGLRKEEGIDFEKAAERAGHKKYTPISIEDYEYRIVGERIEFNNFWQQAQTNMKQPEVQGQWLNLLGKYGLFSGGYDDTWSRRLGRFIGGTTSKEIKALPSSMSKHMTHRGKWAAVVPVWDVPGRVSGCYLFSSAALKFSNFNIRPGGDTEYYNEGLALLPYLKSGTPRVFVLNDILTALHLQRRHLDENHRQASLPIVVCSSGTHGTWELLSRFTQEIVLWQRGGWSEDIFVAANRSPLQKSTYLADSPLWRAETRLEIAQEVAETLPCLALAQMKDSSRAFHMLEGLGTYLTQATAEERSRVARQLKSEGLTDDQRRDLMDQVPSDLHGYIQPYFLEEEGRKEVKLYEQTFELSKGQLYMSPTLRNKGRLLCEATIQIRSITYYADINQRWFSGVIVVDGKEIPFTESEKVIVKDFAAWVKQTTMTAGIDPGWVDDKIASKSVLSVLLQLSKPPLTSSSARVGWSAKQDCFCFPRFHIKDGLVVKKETLVPDAIEAPARCLRPPLGISTLAVAKLLDGSPTSSSFWALFVPLLRNFLASLEGWDCSNIGVPCCGDTHPVVDWFQDRVGLQSVTVNHKPDIAAMQVSAQLHDLSLIIRPTLAGSGAMYPWLYTGDVANVMVVVSELAGKLMLFNNIWTLANAPASVLDMRRLKQAERVLISYLCWFERDRPSFDSRNALDSVADSVDAWLSKCIGKPVTAVTENTQCYVVSPSAKGHYGKRFVEVVEYLLEKKSIEASEDPKAAKAVVIRGVDAVTIRYPPLDKLLRNLGFPGLSRSTINSLLVQASSYMGNDATSCTIPWDLYNKWKESAA